MALATFRLRTLDAPRRTRDDEEPHRDKPRLSVVIVNFRQWENTARLVRQLRNADCVRRGDAEIVVADNHSPMDGHARWLKARAGVSVVRLDRNRGFAAAVNEGCRLSEGRWLLLLNPDMSARPGFLDDMLAAAERLPAQDPEAGVVGFRLINTNGSAQGSCGRYPTLARTLGGLLLPRAVRKCYAPAGDDRRRVNWLTGCCLLVSRDCFRELGGLDEEYFLYYEDVDFCQRAAAAGWSVVFDPALSLTHHWPLHCRAVSPVLRVMTRHALLTYARKHWRGWQADLLSHIVRFEACCREAVARLRGQNVAAGMFAGLRRIADACRRGRPALARRILLSSARDLDTLPPPAVPSPLPSVTAIGAVVARVSA